MRWARREWVTRHWASILLVTAGFVIGLVGLLERRDSLGRIAIGAGLLLAGVFADRLLRAKVGPGGAEIELERSTAESTTEVTRSRAAVQSPAFPDSERLVDVHRVALGYDVIAFLTRPTEGPLVGCAFQLYLFDADEEMLLPALPSGHSEPSPRFRIGEGVAGKAWATSQFIIAEGPEASDATFSLSADKRARYADLAAVAAIPVTSAAGRVIAVLSASATDSETGLVTEEGFEAMVGLADAMARVLVDLLKWFGDGYDDWQ